MFSIAFFVFLTSYGIGWILTFVICRIAVGIGFVDEPGGRKMHDRPMPLGGGVAIFAATAGPVLLGYFLTTSWPLWLPQVIVEYMGKLPDVSWHLLILWGGGLIFLVMGLLDDWLDLSPYPRLAVQVLVAAAVYVLSYVAAGGPQGEVKLGAPVFEHIPVLQGLLTVLWIVGLANAFNFLDNTDGMCAGVALVCSAVLFTVAIQTEQPMIAASLVAFMGALAGFLLFNFPPARVFMGDAGSMFIGYFMAIMSMGVTFFTPGQKPPSPVIAAIIPVLVMLVPIYDAATVVLIRLREGRSPFRPDRRHFSHRLLALGMSRAELLVTVYMIVFAIGIAATLLPQLRPWGQVAVVVQALVILSLITLLENAGRRHRREP